MHQLGVEAKREEIRGWVQQQPDEEVSNDTLVGREVFFRIACSTMEQQQTAEKAFRLFDKDQKGMICFEDLVRVSVELGEEMSEEELQEMVQEADRNGEGLVDLQDFFRLARKIKL
uniref:EF-hand domain-containing protein n=1 Tax=Cyclophora tenuis TaxID=216820 RepID=A0A7S1D4K6_CYCTE